MNTPLRISLLHLLTRCPYRSESSWAALSAEDRALLDSLRDRVGWPWSTADGEVRVTSAELAVVERIAQSAGAGA